jgi:hypothetical protein
VTSADRAPSTPTLCASCAASSSQTRRTGSRCCRSWRRTSSRRDSKKSVSEWTRRTACGASIYSYQGSALGVAGPFEKQK